ncbi:MAG: uracil phosphoribosyltransferase [Hyphomicrobiales bacterium]|jgi:uracil phosphoribosyltransferase|nr:MAG: uracil phosphoribosyltransferase [Hyphomicrobiales bacterium]
MPTAEFPTLTIVDHPLVAHKLSLMRVSTTSSKGFRELLREISLLLGYEVLRDLPTELRAIETPVGPTQAPFLVGKKLVFVPILRAGLGLLDGLLELVPSARVGHVGLYRDPDTLGAIEYYLKTPEDLSERLAIVCDPMLATGNSAIAAVSRLKEQGAREIKLVCLLAAPEGVRALAAAHPDVSVFTASLDSHLNEHGYIVPGLGDAGDRMFGTK